MRNIRNYADIKTARAAGELTPAEEKLIECCQSGERCVLGDGKRPAAPSPERSVGADLLRYLILGGCDGCRVHDRGVMVAGAYIAQRLDLSFATAKGATTLHHCRFEQRISAQDTVFDQLNLRGSHLRDGIFAQGAKVAGNVFLDEKLTATGTVDFNSSDIDGQLTCHGSRFSVAEGKTLNAQGAKIAGGVFLSGGFYADGEVGFGGADIGGQLACVNGSFQAEQGTALYLQDTRANTFFWRDVTAINGELDLNGAHFSTLTDDPGSWEKVQGLNLVGFTYDHITNPGDTGKRLEWLGKGDGINGEFSQQPYTQLAKVLRAMGHDRDARTVAVEGEARHRRSEWVDIEALRANRSALRRFLKSPNEETKEAYVEKVGNYESTKLSERFQRIYLDAGKDHPNRPSDGQLALAKVGFRHDLQWLNAKDKLRIHWLKAKNLSLRWLVGYGYQPFNSLWSLAALVLLAAFVSHMAWRAGDFAPNSDVILSTAEWQRLAEDDGVSNPARAWSDKHGKGRDYESFNALAYGFDVVVPIVNIGQEAAWAPSTARGLWGWHLWWLRWVFTVFGWIVTALGAAAIAGIIRRE